MLVRLARSPAPGPARAALAAEVGGVGAAGQGAPRRRLAAVSLVKLAKGDGVQQDGAVRVGGDDPGEISHRPAPGRPLRLLGPDRLGHRIRLQLAHLCPK